MSANFAQVPPLAGSRLHGRDVRADARPSRALRGVEPRKSPDASRGRRRGAARTSAAAARDVHALWYLSSKGFSEKDIAKIATTTPEVLSLPRSRVESLLEFLSILIPSAEKIRAVVVRHPNTLLSPLETKAKPAVEFLYDLGLDKESVSSVILRFPNLLGYGVKADLTPQVHYLVSLGVSRDSVPDLVKERPQVLSDYIEPVVRYLRLLGLKRKDIGKLLASFPIDYSVPVYLPDKKETHQDEEGPGIFRN